MVLRGDTSQKEVIQLLAGFQLRNPPSWLLSPRTTFGRDWQDFGIWAELVDRATEPFHPQGCERVLLDGSPASAFEDQSCL
jgi:hypothetical protein